MKKILLLVVYLFIGSNLFAQGVDFQELSLAKALEKAKGENKYVFVDCYTSWCGPCKMMASQVLAQKKVGDYMNDKFVSVKIDMEKGEGPDVKKRYGVKAYPTFLVIQPDGTLIHQVVGYCEPDKFIKQVGESFDPSKATETLRARYNGGERNRQFMLNYLDVLLAIGDRSVRKVAQEIFTGLNEEEKFSPDYWFLYENMELNTVGVDMYNFLLANRERFNMIIGKERVDNFLRRCNMEYLKWASFGETDMTDERRTEIQKNLDKVNISELYPFWEVVQACRSKETKRMVNTCKKNFPKMDLHLCGSYYSMFKNLIEEKGTAGQKKAWEKLREDIKKRRETEQQKMEEM